MTKGGNNSILLFLGPVWLGQSFETILDLLVKVGVIVLCTLSSALFLRCLLHCILIIGR